MTATANPRFSTDALRRLAGDKVLARGVEYHRKGLVEIVAIDPSRVVAGVAGSEDYRTEVTGSGAKIGGSCSCRAFSDWGFCKHLVATALAANAASDGAESEAEERTGRIRQHLTTLGVDGLVALVMNVASRDRDLLRTLDLQSAVTRGSDATTEARLERALVQVIRTREYIEYRQASAWADRIETALRAVADLVPAGRATIALRLAERALDLIEEAAPSVDDSNGTCGELLNSVQEIHLAAARAERPEPVGFARELFAREMEDEYDTFWDSARQYADVLGETGLAEYKRLALEAWAALGPAKRGRGQAPSFDGNQFRLKTVLDFFAERDGDLDARIALRARELSSPYSYLDLAQFCLEHGRQEEALRRAEEGLWMFEDGRPDTRLVLFAVERLLKAGRQADAEAHLWRAFEAEPELKLYLRLRPLAGEAACDRAMTILGKRSSKRQSAKPRWSFHPASDDLGVQILMQEGRLDQAWQIARVWNCSPGMREKLARASEATHAGEALAVYRERVEELALLGGDSYGQVAEIVGRMANLQGRSEQDTFLAGLKERHKRRRNLMKLIT